MNFRFENLGFRLFGRGLSPIRLAGIRCAGFTIVELLVVISIIATIATLATGAAMKAVKMSRSRRIDANVQMLALALENYHSLHGEWSFQKDIDPDKAELDETSDETKRSGKIFLFWEGPGNRKNWPSNAKVFGDIFEDVKRNRVHVDTSVIFTKGSQGRMTVKQALEKSMPGDNIPVGYPDPSNQNNFKYFKVTYNFITDAITVSRTD